MVAAVDWSKTVRFAAAAGANPATALIYTMRHLRMQCLISIMPGR
jgi:hypothetical protein